MTTRVESGGPEHLAELEPLWLQMLHHHRDVVEDRVGVLDDAASWAATHAKYREWFEKDEALLLLARDDEGRLLGYLFCHVTGDTGRTFDLGERHGNVDSLVVDREARGGGIGSALLEACRSGLRERGGRTWSVGVVVGNDGAQALYERFGFRPHYLDLLGALD